MLWILIALMLVPYAVLAQEPASPDPKETAATTTYVQDTYAFASNDEGRIVFAFSTDELQTNVLYQFNVDTNRDGVEDRVVQVTLSQAEPRTATFTGPSVPERTADSISPVKADSLSGPVSTHASPQILSERGNPMRAFIGLRDNPVGSREIDGSNIQIVAVELPLDQLLAENKPDFDFWVSVYARTD